MRYTKNFNHPLTARIGRKIWLARKFHETPILERAIFYSDSEHDLAASLLAYMFYYNRNIELEPAQYEKPIFVKAIALLNDYVALLTQWLPKNNDGYIPNRDFKVDKPKYDNKCQYKLTTSVLNSWDGCGAVYALPMSDEARKQASARNKDNFRHYDRFIKPSLNIKRENLHTIRSAMTGARIKMS